MVVLSLVFGCLAGARTIAGSPVSCTREPKMVTPGRLPAEYLLSKTPTVIPFGKKIFDVSISNWERELCNDPNHDDQDYNQTKCLGDQDL
jgi:hypothetical protein